MCELDANQTDFSFDKQRVKRLREVCSKKGIIGQPRALAALKMGMSVNAKGYNVYISGEDGTGRHSAIREIASAMRCDSVTANFEMCPEDPCTPVLVCHKESRKICPPVVEENNPTYENVFGKAIRDTSGNVTFSTGSLMKACGGFLVMDAEQVVENRTLWDAVRTFALTSQFSVKDSDRENAGFIRPVFRDVLPVKIILTGSDELYDRLCSKDGFFLRCFKICAEFDFSMPASDENIGGTIAYILNVAEEKKLGEVDDDALCELLRYSCWYAEMRDELTTKLSFVGDLLCEAAYYAQGVIDGDAVKKAFEQRDFAAGITGSRIYQEIRNGEMIISLEGTKTGVVNGLAVIDRGLISIGTPTVISVSVAPGSEGIVNIEHEAGLSGEIHDKGFLILEGYLRKQYARTFPLSIYAGICFEQSYSEVDGDSASSSELFALLSAIGELPVRQDIAVTGSVNQLGDIQPVGGINEKITGFFDICTAMGLTGKQGVIIPSQNIKSLILPRRIAEAVENRKFHIYPISSVDEGMEILTLRNGGQRNQKGVFPAGSTNRVIEDRLRHLYELSKPSG
ncbi:MAG: AAA family ATPase [Sphaerochaetaceae bacterium]|nr:AAA family ATPase [Sphaerochaetaceae bacterium]